MNHPRNLAGDIPGPPAATPEGFQHWEKLVGPGPQKVTTLNAWHDRTHIIATTTMMLDKHALVKASFSMKDLIHQAPERSIPHQISSPEGFAPPEKVLPPTAA
jgi:hypothetical protein